MSSFSNPAPATPTQIGARITASVGRISDLAGQLVTALSDLPATGRVAALEEQMRVELTELRSWARMD